MKTRKRSSFLAPSSKGRISVIGLVALVSAVALVISGGVGGAATTGTTSSRGLDRVTTMAGAVVPLLPNDLQALQRFSAGGAKLTGATLIATRGDRRYFRVNNASGAACYAVGPAAASATFRLGQIMCAPDFPSAARPVLDLTVLQNPSGRPANARVTRSEGFAADGVAVVAFRTDAGALIHRVPVVNNVYSTVVPFAQAVTGLVGLNASGVVVWQESFNPIAFS